MEPRDIRKATVIGAGAMGHSIAQVYAQCGIATHLVDRSEAALERAVGLISNNLSTLAEYGRLRETEIDEILGRVHITVEMEEALRGADFVIEAVNESPEIKKEVFARIDEACSENTVVASNTSGLDIYEIAHIKNPGRLIIHHWFAPPHLIPLVEVVPGPSTSEQTVAFSMSFLKMLGKKPVLMKEFVRSFIVNRIQNYIALAFYEILEKGWASPEDIDLAVKSSLGIRLPIVGVVQSQDFTGLDLVLDVQKSYGMSFGCVESRVREGHLGVKTSRGFFNYDGRSEEEILKKRDILYLKMLDFMEETGAYEAV